MKDSREEPLLPNHHRGCSLFCPPGDKYETQQPPAMASVASKELVSPCLSATSLGTSRTTSMSDLRDQPSLENLEMAATWSPQSTSTQLRYNTPSPTPRSAVAQRRVSFGKTQVIIIAPRTPSPPCPPTLFLSPSLGRGSGGGGAVDSDAVQQQQPQPPMSPIQSCTLPPALRVLNSHGHVTRPAPAMSGEGVASSTLSPCPPYPAESQPAPQGKHDDDVPTPSVSGRASPASATHVLRSASAVLKVMVSPIAAIRLVVRSDGSLSPGCSQPPTS